MTYTNDYIRREIRGQILNKGGFTVFWATENMRRAIEREILGEIEK